MADIIEIRWTAGSIDEARKVSRYLVQERLVASAQIIPWVEKISMWNNQLETDQESTICFISFFENFEKICEIILKNSKYQVPEISYALLKGGNEAYFRWISENVLTTEKKKDQASSETYAS